MGRSDLKVFKAVFYRRAGRKFSEAFAAIDFEDALKQAQAFLQKDWEEEREDMMRVDGQFLAVWSAPTLKLVSLTDTGLFLVQNK